MIYFKNQYLQLKVENSEKYHVISPVAEFSVLVCSTPKFICSSDYGVPRLLITENDLL